MEDIMFAYESQGIKNYVYAETEDAISKYQVKMMEANEIDGLLPMHRTVFNGVNKLSYDITKRRRLREVLQGHELRGDAAKQFLIDVLETVLGIEDYFLLYNRIFLNVDYIYLNENGQVGMLYIPYQEKEVLTDEGIRDFYKILLDYLAEDNDGYSSSLFRYLNKQEFTVAGLLELLKGSNVARTVNDAMRYDAVEMPRNSVQASYQVQQTPNMKPVEEKEEKKKLVFGFDKKIKAGEADKSKKSESDFGEFGFVVPGMENVEKSDKKENAQLKDKPEKKGLFGGLFTGKKEEQEVKAEPVLEVKAVREERNVSHDNAVAKQEVWRGTVTLDEAKSSGTIMLGADSEMPYLVHRGNRIIISRFPFSIGRNQGMDYTIEIPVISQKHAVVSSKNGKYFIIDENSANHTYINGVQIPPFTECEIRSDDILRLANEDMQFFA